MRYQGRLLRNRKKISVLRHPKNNKRTRIRLLVYCLLVTALLGFLKAYSYYYQKANEPEPDTKAPRKLNGTFEQGLLYNSLKELNFSEGEIANITNALENVIDPKTLSKEDSFFIAMSSAGEFHRLVITHGIKKYCVSKINENKYVSSELTMQIFESQKSVAGTIENSLWNSMISAGLSPQVIMEFADVFAWNIDFLTEVRPGDRYAVIWNEKNITDGQVIGQQVLGACYEGKETDMKKGFLWEDDYYDLSGDALEKMFLRAPLNYRRISSHFSRGRFHPVLRIYRPHNGTDYVAPKGTPVSCVAKGKVIFAGRKGGLGNYVEIKHDFDYVTGYGHLSAYATGIAHGAKVKQGQIVGYVGSTGLSTGPHLDFRIRQNGQYFNFIKFKNRSAKGLAKSKLPQFKEIVKELNSQLELELDKLENIPEVEKVS